jgi:hypothetical protein
VKLFNGQFSNLNLESCLKVNLNIAADNATVAVKKAKLNNIDFIANNIREKPVKTISDVKKML